MQKITRYALQKLLVAKITRYSLQNSLVTRCRSGSLQIITRYSLQKLLVPKNHSLLVQNSLVTSCKNPLVTRYEKTPKTNVYLKPIKLGEFYLLILYFQLTKSRERYTIKLASQKYSAI